VLHSLYKNLPETHVVMLSLHDEEFYVLNSIMNGASGYILKEDVCAHLALAVSAVASGRFYFSPILRERIVLSEFGNPTDRVEFLDALTSQIPDLRVNDILSNLSTDMTLVHFPPPFGAEITNPNKIINRRNK
jgi:DNA-binding NarL/FixJ family response regulator